MKDLPIAWSGGQYGRSMGKKQIVVVGVAAVLLYQALVSMFNALGFASIWERPLWARQGSGLGDAGASKGFSWFDVPSTPDLHFQPCYDQFQCTRLSLPMDYWNDTTTANISLAVLRLPAKVPITDPRWGGAIVVNPGGPGGAGTLFVRFVGPLLQNLLDAGTGNSSAPSNSSDEKYYDILSFDPRGVGFTTPIAKCFNSSLERRSWLLRLSEEGVLGSSDAAFGRLYSMHHAFGDACAFDVKDDEGETVMRYISTAYVARDMLELVDGFGRWRERGAERLIRQGSDGLSRSEVVRVRKAMRYKPGEEKLQYWGFSYGTFLGSTFASMYPNRVGRVVLDGVVEALDYVAGLWAGNLQDTEKTLQTFYDSCAAAGPEKCALANGTSTAADVERRVQSIVWGLYHNPFPIPAPVPIVITFSNVKHWIFSSLYAPIMRFRNLAGLLAAIDCGDGNELAAYLSRQYPVSCVSGDADGFPPEGEAQIAIACTDGEPQNVFDRSVFARHWHILESKSPSAGSIWAGIRLTMSGWKTWPVFRFTGPFGAETSHPILWVGNVADPVTPVGSAHKMATLFPDSVVLTQDSPGHTSLAAFSSCTVGRIRTYFFNGTLPAPDTLCPADQAPFSDALKHLEGLRTPSVPVSRQSEMQAAAVHSGIAQVFAEGRYGFGSGFGERLHDLILHAEKAS